MTRSSFSLLTTSCLIIVIVPSISYAWVTDLLGVPVQKPSQNTELIEKTRSTALSSTSPKKTFRSDLIVPIILYHHIRPITGTLDDLGKSLSVTPETFKEQLSFFKKKGFTTISLQQLNDALTKDISLPPKPLVLSFDDGYDDMYSHAYPLLRQFGMTGTLFVITNFVGKRGYATWQQVEEMDANGVLDAQSHTVNHVSLPSEPREQLSFEISESKRVLEKKLRKTVEYFCYPYGHYSPLTLSLVRRAGYKAALTTRFGVHHSKNDLFETTRIRLSNYDTGKRLERKLQNILGK